MSHGGDKEVELWGGIVSYRESAPSARMQAVQAARPPFNASSLTVRRSTQKPSLSSVNHFARHAVVRP
jgi:hypothetical protein